MAALKLGRDVCKDGSVFQRFITDFRSAASDLDPSNNVVGILKSLTTRVSNITLEMQDIVIQLHIRYKDSYLLGLKVNEGDWYEGDWYSLRKKKDRFNHFDVAEKPMGFGVGYRAMGYAFDSDLKRIKLGHGRLQVAMDRMRRFSKNPDSVVFTQHQESVAIVVLSVCEAARLDIVQREIESSFMSTVKLSDASVVAIKAWDELHKDYNKDPGGYTGDLRLVQRRLLTSRQSDTSQAEAGPSSFRPNKSMKKSRKY